MQESGRVLIADDEDEIRNILSDRLESLGFQVYVASHGEEALSLLERYAPHVVVLDAFLPGLAGMETLRQIRQGHPATEVILLASSRSVEAALEGMKCGAFDYLLKPCDSDLLLGRIQRARERMDIAGPANICDSAAWGRR